MDRYAVLLNMDIYCLFTLLQSGFNAAVCQHRRLKCHDQGFLLEDHMTACLSSNERYKQQDSGYSYIESSGPSLISYQVSYSQIYLIKNTEIYSFTSHFHLGLHNRITVTLYYPENGYKRKVTYLPTSLSYFFNKRKSKR